MIKAVFSASLLQSSVSHDPSEIILMLICCSKTLMSMLKKNIWDSLNRNLYEVEIVSNSINVFTATFDQFNASLLNKSINFFPKKKSLTDPKLLNCICYKIFIFQINAVRFKFLFIIESWKKKFLHNCSTLIMFFEPKKISILLHCKT